jgi:NAD(P)-dependent dehydrogenase (short-subunit alcohol dehydrogenase family)
MTASDARTIMSDLLSGRTTVVVGASRGLGRGIARAFAEAGAPVVAVARTGPALAELATTSTNIRTEVADAADATVAWSLLDQYEPEVLILVAGANPVMRPLQYQTWETFSLNWHTDVKIAFTWLREALLKPLPPGSRVVVVVSSGAAINRITGQRRLRRGPRPPSGQSRDTPRRSAPCRAGH